MQVRLERLEEARRVVAVGEERGREVVAFSVSAYEKGKKKKKRVLEIGWAKTRIGERVEAIEVHHVVIKEHLALRNGLSVPDRKDGESFVGIPELYLRGRDLWPRSFAAFDVGDSQILPYAQARDLLLIAISSPDRDLPLVGSAVHWPLQVLGLDLALPTSFDIGSLYRTARRDRGIGSTLEDLIKKYSVPYRADLLHNAGEFALNVDENWS